MHAKTAVSFVARQPGSWKTRVLALTSLALLAAALFSPQSAVAGSVTSTSSAAPSVATALVNGHRWVGFYQPGASVNAAILKGTESQIGMGPARFANYFQNTEQDFTAGPAGNLVAHGSIPLITLEMWNPSNGVSQSSYQLRDISSGSWDSYLRTYAREAKAFGHTVWLRPFHEMNGFWYPWCGTVNGNSPSDFITAWRHMHDVFVSEGATNVQFVWCPNIESLDCNSSLTNPANAITAYWPGADYVDYIALDGYNYGPAAGLKWRSFSSLFGPAYKSVASLPGNKPIFIAETSCSEVGGSKAAWISDMFRVIPVSFPRIVGVGWFNVLNPPGHPNCRFLVNSSSTSLRAFAYGAFGPTWMPKATTVTSFKPPATYGSLNRAFSLTGRLWIGHYRDVVYVDVMKPGMKKWAVSSGRLTNSSGYWSYGYVPRARGTYYFRARFAGDAPRFSSVSRTVKVIVR